MGEGHIFFENTVNVKYVEPKKKGCNSHTNAARLSTPEKNGLGEKYI